MPLLRTKINEFKKVVEKPAWTERRAADYDLAWDSLDDKGKKLGQWQVYILAEHECFDEYYGPSFIAQYDAGGFGTTTNEYYVNDPIMWAWIRRLIKQGHLTPETMLNTEVTDSERDIVEVFDSPPVATDKASQMPKGDTE